MLDQLLETGARRRKSAWGGILSIGVHGAIIVVAVVATAKATPAPRYVREDPRIIRVAPPPTDHAKGPAGRDGAHSSNTSTALPEIPTVDIPQPTDPSLPTSAPLSAAGADTTLLSEIRRGGSGAGAAVGATILATDATVDLPVRALLDRAPAYPETLRAAGIAGMVRVQFVVDTNGRAELSTVRIIESTHELFTRSVLASLRQARFTPGEVSGHRVRTLVERAYRFDIGDSVR
jgi:periplasmic protein TonB